MNSKIPRTLQDSGHFPGLSRPGNFVGVGTLIIAAAAAAAAAAKKATNINLIRIRCCFAAIQ